MKTAKTGLTCALILFCFHFIAFAAEDTLIPNGASWRYLDNGTDQGTAWRAFSSRP